MISPWFSLETIPTQSAVRMVWRRRLHNDFEAFRDAFLQPEPEPVTYYPCPYGPGCPHDIVYQADGSILAVCNCPGRERQPASLVPDDIVAWELSWSKLSRALARALGLAPKTAEFGLYNTRQIASWPADDVPIILTIQSEPHHFQHAVAGLLARFRDPFILLSPTTALADATSKLLLANNKSALFPLDSKFILTGAGSVQPLVPPGELFAAFNPQPKELDEDVAARAVALVKQLDFDTYQVFRLYCIHELSAAQTAARRDCSKATVIRHLKLIQVKTGIHPKNLRRPSAHLAKLTEIADSRASRIHRKRLICDNP